MKEELHKDAPNMNVMELKNFVKENTIYLENSSIDILGYKIYGCPYMLK